MVISCITAVSLLCLSFISIGKNVKVVASTTPNDVSINGCSIGDVYLLGSRDIESSKEIGDRMLVIRIFIGQDNLFTPIEIANVSNHLGLYVVNSPILPGEVSYNSELRVEIKLVDSAGNILSEDEKTITYK